MKSILICLSFVLFTSPFFAQGIAERNVVKLPKPKLPAEAKESGLGGRVTVLVEIDDAGNVTAIKDTTGPDWVCPSVLRPDVIALRDAAKAAAMEVKFVPASAEGGPVISTMRISFDFPMKKISEKGAKGEYLAAPLDDKGSVKTQGDGNKYTVKGDRDFTGSNTPPPDYTGPVVAAPMGEATIPGNLTGEDSESIRGGVLNGKAVRLPRPPFPPAARAVLASGAVSIQVLIDEEGKIFSAMPVSGHPLLRSAARQAACGAEFSPTLLSGAPVKVAGVIVYNFVP